MNKKYWHELPIGAQNAILHSKLKVGAFMKRYKQPDWCGYPDALGGMMGCWSLMSPGYVRNIKYCRNCCEKRKII